MSRNVGRERPCTSCGKKCRSKYGLCRDCGLRRKRRYATDRSADAEQGLREAEAHRGHELPKIPKLFGDWGIITDLHVPEHDTEGLLYFIECAQLLGVKQLLIAGDLLDNKQWSGFVRYRVKPGISDSLIATRKVLDALLLSFDKIVIFPGNHEQWTEKRMAKAAETRSGRLLLEQVSALLGKEGGVEDVGDLATSYFAHFFDSPQVTFYPLPEAEVNGAWSVVHPGNYSRIPPQTERRMSHVRRKCVIGGHSHLWGVSFDDSATDAVCNTGHLTRDSHRYRVAKPTTHPNWVRGFCFILTSDDNPQGELLPIAIHDRYFDLRRLASRLAGAS